MTTPSKQKIQTLLDLINKATNDAIAEYERAGHGVPDPDLKDSHPMDFASDALGLMKATRLLQGACGLLCDTLCQSMGTMYDRAMAMVDMSCVKVVLRLKIPDILQESPEGLHVKDLVGRLKETIDAEKLSRVLRTLASTGCFVEVKQDVFANNRLSYTLVSSNDISAVIGIGAIHGWKGLFAIADTMVHPEFGLANTPERSPLVYAMKEEGMEWFEYLHGHPEDHEMFSRAMTGGSAIFGATCFVTGLPWTEGAKFCDIGAGLSENSMVLAKRYKLQTTLQDRPETLDRAREFWKASSPQALDSEQVKFVPIDFMKESPVPDQDIYYMKFIIHDWPDAEAVTILRNVASVMTPRSRLLLHEQVVQHLHGDGDNPTLLEKAPKPLLPNYGSGGLRPYRMDICMFAMTNGKERTYEAFVHIGEKSGLVLKKVFDLGELCVLEYKLA